MGTGLSIQCVIAIVSCGHFKTHEAAEMESPFCRQANKEAETSLGRRLWKPSERLHGPSSSASQGELRQEPPAQKLTAGSPASEVKVMRDDRRVCGSSRKDIHQGFLEIKV